MAKLTVPAKPTKRQFDAALSNGTIRRHNVVLRNMKELLRIAYVEMTKAGAAEIKDTAAGRDEQVEAERDRMRKALQEIDDHPPWGGDDITAYIKWLRGLARAALRES